MDTLVEDLWELVLVARRGEAGRVASLLNTMLPTLQTVLLAAEGSLVGALSTLLEMQQNEDWVAFADILEYELIPHLVEENV